MGATSQVTEAPRIPLCSNSMDRKKRHDEQQLMEWAHSLSAGVLDVARGLNDNSKMAALLLALSQMRINWARGFIIIALVISGLMGARKVVETMFHKISRMKHVQGFSVNLGTAILVTMGSLYELPGSTTHVSAGSLFGISMVTRAAEFSSIGEVLKSWIITLSCTVIKGM